MKMSLASLKRGISAAIGLIILVTGSFGIAAPSHAAADHSVTIHYHRFAGDYTGWDIWSWPKGKAGKAYTFGGTPDSFGQVANYTVTGSGTGDVGFIIRFGGDKWTAKDVGADRYISQWDGNNNAEIWLVEGDATIYTSQPTITPTIISASAVAFNKLKVKLNVPLAVTSGDNGFVLNGPAGTPTVTSVTADDHLANSVNLTVNLSGNISFGNQYTLSQTTYSSSGLDLSPLYDSQQFADAFTYTGNDLGATYTSGSTAFRVWAPTASAVSLMTYGTLANPTAATEVPMTQDVNGTWVTSLTGDQNGLVYMYQVAVNGDVNLANDPYARAVTLNGEQSVVVDLSQTNPSGFTTETKPAFSGNPTDASIYEIHVRDLSEDPSSGIPADHVGKYLAFTDLNTKTPDGKSLTGISYIKKLGVTHVELLPVYDFNSVDESNPTFNWGYDPANYNAPEGSYSSDPSNPTTRIVELKSAIQAMHAQGLRVNMDVVYNHVANAASFAEQLIVPGYWFRHNPDGSLANGTGVGNEVASERPMVRKFIVDSVSYWASQYHFDGFRFDLMGILDTTTMNAIRTSLNQIDPSIIMIGEGWNMGNSLSLSQRANQTNLSGMPGIAAFNDTIRDGLKGSVFTATDTGWATGTPAVGYKVQQGIIGMSQFSIGLSGGWGNTQPSQSVNYVECHDNLTLWDKLAASTSLSVANRTKVDQMIGSVVILAQGVPFQQAGQEFLRSKNGNDNSYNSPDSINSIKWNLAASNANTVNYYAGLYALRAAHPAFRLATTVAVRSTLKFLNQTKGVIAYSLNGKAAGDKAGTIFVAHNPNKVNMTVKLPATGTWSVLVNGTKAGTKVLARVKGKTAVVPAYSTLVL
ncbi:MAG: type I pullulanase, partial [Micrococcales bacterium]